MTNALQINASTVVGGLGTQSYTVPAALAGMMTLEFKSFIPYAPAGTPAQSSVPTANVVNVTAAADTAGSKNSTFWTFYTAGNQYGYYVWYNINSAGVDPAPAGLLGIEVDGATGATAATLATATIAAIVASSANTYVAATAGTSGHLILTNRQFGLVTAAANGSASYGASFSVTTAGSFGVPETSGLVVKVLQNSTELLSVFNTSATAPLLGSSVHFLAVAADVISFVASSLSGADNALNAVKSIVNLYQGE